jgi:hypothetical protein
MYDYRLIATDSLQTLLSDTPSSKVQFVNQF